MRVTAGSLPDLYLAHISLLRTDYVGPPINVFLISINLWHSSLGISTRYSVLCQRWRGRTKAWKLVSREDKPETYAEILCVQSEGGTRHLQECWSLGVTHCCRHLRVIQEAPSIPSLALPLTSLGASRRFLNFSESQETHLQNKYLKKNIRELNWGSGRVLFWVPCRSFFKPLPCKAGHHDFVLLGGNRRFRGVEAPAGKVYRGAVKIRIQNHLLSSLFVPLT